MDEELQAARERIAALERELEQARSGASDTAFVNELRARLAQVGATALLGSPSEHTALLEQIVQAAMHVLNARAGSLYLVDEDSESLVWEVALGERAAQLIGQRIPLGQGVAGWVAATGQAIAVSDVQSDPRWAQEIGRAVGYMPKTMLAVPLIVHDRVTGVLQLLDRDGGSPFSAADMETLGRFANQAAVAIQQSRSIRTLSSLLRAGLTSLESEDSNLLERAAAFAGRVESSPDYQETLDLAALVGETARRGDEGRRLALDIMRAVTTYLRGQRRYGGM